MCSGIRAHGIREYIIWGYGDKGIRYTGIIQGLYSFVPFLTTSTSSFGAIHVLAFIVPELALSC